MKLNFKLRQTKAAAAAVAAVAAAAVVCSAIEVTQAGNWVNGSVLAEDRLHDAHAAYAAYTQRGGLSLQSCNRHSALV